MSTIGGGGNGENFQLDRKKSEQAFDVFILGFNDSAEKKSKVSGISSIICTFLLPSKFKCLMLRILQTLSNCE